MLPGSLTELFLTAYPDMRVLMGLPEIVVDAAVAEGQRRARQALLGFFLAAVVAIFLYWLLEKKLEVF